MVHVKRTRFMDTLPVKQPEQTSFIGSLAALRLSGDLCDCVLVSADGAEFQAHRVVLAAASLFFRALYAGSGQQMLDSSTTNVHGQYRIQLCNITGQGLELALSAMYQQELQLSEQSVERLLEDAAYLQIECATTACHQWLMQNGCHSSHSIWVMSIAEQYGFEDVFQQALAAVKGCPKDLLRPEQLSNLRVLTCYGLGAILQHFATWESFPECFQMIATWANAEPASRAQDVSSLCGQVFIPLVRLEAVVEQLQCAPEVRQAFAKYLASRRKQLIDRFETMSLPQSWEGGQRFAAGDARLLIAGGHDVAWQSLRSVEMYSYTQDRWSKGVPMPNKESFAGCAVLADKVALVGGGLHGSTLSLYSPASQSWCIAEPPNTPHQHSAVAAIQDSLFLMGGKAGSGAKCELKTVEVCNAVPAEPFADWSSSSFMRWHNAACMTVPRACLAAATLQSTLYAAGGQAGRAIWDTMEAYDPHHDSWSAVAARMHSGRKYTSAGVLQGRLYIVGGMTSARTRLRSVEAFDPREGQWELMPEMSVPRSSAGVAALAEGLFVVGGNAGEDSIHNSVEMFVPAAGKWLERAPIAHARSGLAIAAL